MPSPTDGVQQTCRRARRAAAWQRRDDGDARDDDNAPSPGDTRGAGESAVAVRHARARSNAPSPCGTLNVGRIAAGLCEAGQAQGHAIVPSAASD